MKTNRAGKYRQRITVWAQVDAEAVDSVGQPVESWTATGTYWGEVVPQGGAELLQADQVKHGASYVVTMRYQGSASITAANRLTVKGKTFNVVNVNDTEERGRQLVISCKEAV